MQIKTKGIVIGQVKYTGSRVILQIFTREQGWLSFITRVGGKSRPRALTQLCTPVELDFDFKENVELHTIKSIQLDDLKVSGSSDVLKSAVQMFLAEILYRSLHRNYVNKALFDHIYALLDTLMQSENVAMFPIQIALILCTDLGFDIPLPEKAGHNYFDPVEGYFQSSSGGAGKSDEQVTAAFIELLEGFQSGHILSIPSSSIRKEILNLLIAYLRERLEIKSPIRSHEVLEVIFH